MDTNKPFLIYIIAGEPSGDFIGSKLISKLKLTKPNVKVIGVGGSLMAKEGLKSLFDIKFISIMGIFEIIPRLWKIFKLIKLTLEDIKIKKPDMLITIDSPGFNLRVAMLARKAFGKNIKIIHYVAPTVWAYKPKRAKKFAKIFDYLFCLLPFEPPYFKKEGLNTFFVGHPIVESNIIPVLQNTLNKTNKLNNTPFNNLNNSSNRTTILLLPGSRVKEVNNLLPIFLKAADIIRQQYPQLKIVIITIPELVSLVKRLSLNYNVSIITHETVKYEYFLKSKVALAASGTVTLELALANVKTVVAYKLNILTSLLFVLLVKVKFVSIINIMANKCIFPEILGPKCKSKNLANAAVKLIKSEILNYNTIYEILYSLGYNNFVPSMKAANLVEDILENN